MGTFLYTADEQHEVKTCNFKGNLAAREMLVTSIRILHDCDIRQQAAVLLVRLQDNTQRDSLS